ncbi:hypothetical protein FGB62_69g18 [Gracilaria domingensis]|nr:hypothetical protein FGB62_69g18 [Gracilaria domingensis]
MDAPAFYARPQAFLPCAPWRSLPNGSRASSFTSRKSFVLRKRTASASARSARLRRRSAVTIRATTNGDSSEGEDMWQQALQELFMETLRTYYQGTPMLTDSEFQTLRDELEHLGKNQLRLDRMEKVEEFEMSEEELRVLKTKLLKAGVVKRPEKSANLSAQREHHDEEDDARFLEGHSDKCNDARRIDADARMDERLKCVRVHHSIRVTRRRNAHHSDGCWAVPTGHFVVRCGTNDSMVFQSSDAGHVGLLGPRAAELAAGRVPRVSVPVLLPFVVDKFTRAACGYILHHDVGPSRCGCRTMPFLEVRAKPNNHWFGAVARQCVISGGRHRWSNGPPHPVDVHERSGLEESPPWRKDKGTGRQGTYECRNIQGEAMTTASPLKTNKRKKGSCVEAKTTTPAAPPTSAPASASPSREYASPSAPPPRTAPTDFHGQ